MGEIHELFVLALSLVWFAGATPDFCFSCPGTNFPKAPVTKIRYHLRKKSQCQARRRLASSYLLESGSEKGVSWKRGLFKKVHFLEILENLESCQTVESNGESDHFLEILENLEILEIPPAKRPLS